MHRARAMMTPANTVTVSRMVLIPVFLVALLADWPSWLAVPHWMIAFKPWVAATVFTLLAATDGVDGYLARSRNEITTFGKFIDPLADKLLVSAALLALIELNVLPAWIAFVIISREFIVSGLRMVASAEGIVIAASWYGKLKTVLQIIAIVMFIVKDSSLLERVGGWFSPAIEMAAWLVMSVAVLMTLASMFDYFKHAADVLIGPWTGADIAVAALSADPEDETTD